MLSLDDHPYLAPFDGSFKEDKWPTGPGKSIPKEQLEKKLKKYSKRLDEQQRMLYAQGKHAVLLVFQALDAAGKDGTIRAVFNRVDPNGVRVSSFKAPSTLERAHDFLWRTNLCLPQRGKIGIFNRSYYEETLVVRVHPEYLQAQNLPEHDDLDTLWEQRFESIRDHEKHLAQSGTVVIKFWLKHSKAEQKRRFLDRINEPEKHWKFSVGDVEERQHWDQYMHCYEETVNATSRPWAPWYVIPADDKPYMRTTVAKIVSKTLSELELAYPQSNEDRREVLAKMKRHLNSE